MTYEELDQMLQGRCRSKRKLEYQTWAEREPYPYAPWPEHRSVLVIRLFNTRILTFWPEGHVTFRTGGWRSQLTLRRMKEYMPREMRGWLFRMHGEFYWCACGRSIQMEDGDTVVRNDGPGWYWSLVPCDPFINFRMEMPQPVKPVVLDHGPRRFVLEEVA